MPPTDHVQNELKRRLKAREPSLAVALRLSRTVDVVGLLAAAGYHAFYVDLQHSSISLEDCAQLCTAGVYAGITPLVRVPDLNEGLIARVLDGGAMGIIAPDISTAHEARDLASWCRFPPAGARSATGPLAMMRHRRAPASEVAVIADAETLVIAMLESTAALENVSDIAAVEGIDALFIGSNDLTAAMGIAGEYRHPMLQDAYRAAIAACRTNGKELLVGGISDPAIIAEYVAEGAAACAFAGNDFVLLAQAAAETADRLRPAVS